MLTLKEWMEIVDYRITEGDDYFMSAYGDKAYFLNSWNGVHDGYSFCVVFDRDTQEIYEVQAHDYKHERAYRLIAPGFENATAEEDGKNAWDHVDYVDLEVDDDFIQKCLAIKTGEDYDTRVSVPLTLEDAEMFELMKLAHEKDMTLNELVEEILTDAVTRARKA